MILILTEGLVLGLSAGVYCVGSCLVFFMPYLLVEGKQKVSENLTRVGQFIFGRLIAYISFAFVMGFLGTTYKNIFTARFANISLIVASLLLLIYALSSNFGGVKFCGKVASTYAFARLPFFLGLFSGLNPCAPFLVGVARLWTLNSILGGVVLFLGFFLGTSLYMLPLIFVSYLTRSERIRRVGFLLSLLSSIWFLFVGITALITG